MTATVALAPAGNCSKPINSIVRVFTSGWVNGFSTVHFEFIIKKRSPHNLGGLTNIPNLSAVHFSVKISQLG